MITKTKLRIKKGQTYLAKFNGTIQELRVCRVVKSENGESMVKHQHGWETLKGFVQRDPIYLGETRIILSIPFGCKSQKNTTI